MATLNLSPSEHRSLRNIDLLPSAQAENSGDGASRPALSLHGFEKTRRRVIRVAASIFDTRNEAENLSLSLQRHWGLYPEQIAVLAPADSQADRFLQLKQRWSRLRPKPSDSALGRTTHAALGAGIALGLTVAWALAVSVPLADAAALSTAVTLGGALVGRLVGGLMEPRPSRRHFDTRLQRKLAAGAYAVVVQGIPEDIAPPVFAKLRSAGHGWCAETALVQACSRASQFGPWRTQSI